MEAQHIADAVLTRALWFAVDSLGRKGDESEIAFLLREMFGYRYEDDPGWVDNQELFDGTTAIELARAPGGISTIRSRLERAKHT